MNPTCENDLSAFGVSSASSSQVTLRETAPKRCKQEGPPIDEGEKKVNLLDLKKEIKEEIAKEIKAEYGKYITQFNAAAKGEMDSNKRVLEEMIRNTAERQEEWAKALVGHHQGIKVEMEQFKELNWKT